MFKHNNFSNMTKIWTTLRATL